MKGVYLFIVPVLTIDVASSMRQRQSRVGYRNILSIADGYVPTVREKSGDYATIHNSDGAERHSSSLLQSIQSEGGYDLTHHPISRWNFSFPLVPLTHTVAHRQFGADGVCSAGWECVHRNKVLRFTVQTN
jgi:hypothetical protein